jgi:hypothetical protein
MIPQSCRLFGKDHAIEMDFRPGGAKRRRIFVETVLPEKNKEQDNGTRT